MRRSQFVLVVLSVLALVVTGCGDRNKDTGFPPPSPRAEHPGDVAVVDSSFDPEEFTVKVGETVEWVQTGTLPHTVTADDRELFDSHPNCTGQDVSDCMQKGDAFEFTFEEEGEYGYFCVLHGTPGGTGMVGKIIVEA